MENLKIVTSPNTGTNLIEDLRKKLEDARIDASTVLLFTTTSTKNMAKKVMEILAEKYPQAQMTGCVVEGYMTKEAVWTRGMAALLMDSEKISIGYTSGQTTEKAFSKLNREVKAKKKVVAFPMVYIPDPFSVLKLLAYDRYYHFRYIRAKDMEEKKRILEKYSRILESKMIYPANKALRYLDGEVAGMNLMPLSGGYRSPALYLNFKECQRCCVCLGMKGSASIHYHDTFPERGKSFDDTFEILKNYFGRVERVKTVFSGIAIGEINGKSAVDFLKEKIRIRKISEEKLKKDKLEKNGLPMVSPYGLVFISRETHGSSALGLQSYPIGIYPSIFELDRFYESCIYTGELFKEGIFNFYGLFDKAKSRDSFKFFVLDYNVIPMFSKKIHLLNNYAKSNFDCYFGIIASTPSVKKNSFERRYMTEIEKGICFNGTGTSFMLEIRDLP